MKQIEIEWSGPIGYEKISDYCDSKIDFGIYCIYGVHAVSGPDTLLYIGKACDQTFATRFGQHDNWMDKECSELKIFIGRLGGASPECKDEDWRKDIANAESILIYYLSPPYNTSSVYKQPYTLEDILILNFGKRHRLPYCITSAYYNSDFYKNRKAWHHYVYNEVPIIKE